MRLLKTMMVGVLGTATLLPALPAWAQANTAGSPGGAATAAPPAAGSTTAQPAANPAAGQPGAPVGNGAVRGNVTMDGGPDGGMPDWMRTRFENRKAFLDARLAAIHAGLELTPAQQPLWAPTEAAIRALVRARHGDRPFGAEEMTGTQRLKMRSARLIAVGQALGKLADATAPLANALSPEQKGRLPVLLRGMRMRRAVAQAFGVGRMMAEGPHWHHHFVGDKRDFDGHDFDGMRRGHDGARFGMDDRHDGPDRFAGRGRGWDERDGGAGD